MFDLGKKKREKTEITSDKQSELLTRVKGLEKKVDKSKLHLFLDKHRVQSSEKELQTWLSCH